MERRFGILAEDLGAYDPEDGYEVDLLTGERRLGKERVMLGGYIAKARLARELDDTAYLAHFPELSRVPALPGEAHDGLIRSVIALHRRQAGEVKKVIDDGGARYAERLYSGHLPDTCLLVQALPEKYVRRENAGAPYAFYKEGSRWVAAFEGMTRSLEDEMGMPYIHAALRAPNRPLSLDSVERHDPTIMGAESGPSEASPEGLEAIRARIAEIERKMEIRAPGTPVPDGLIEERESLIPRLKELEAARRGGESKAAKQQRQRVSAAIRRAKDEIRGYLPRLWLHLDQHLETGKAITYRPGSDLPWQLI